MRSYSQSVVIDYHLERDDNEIILEVNATVYFGSPGRYSGPPEDCYPAEDDAVIIDDILLDGKPWDGVLSSTEYDELYEMVLNATDPYNDCDDSPEYDLDE